MKIGSLKPLQIALAIMFVGATPVCAEAPDPASSTITKFYTTLTDTMKHGKELGAEGRVQKLAPAVDKAFDIPLMAQFAVGPSWTEMSAADRAIVIAAFRRYTIADYAHNFDSFSGERFTIDPSVIVRGPDHIVQTKLVPGSGDTVALNYRTQKTGEAWKIVDVYLDGYVSELSTRRSDYASTLNTGGGPALAKKLDALSDKLTNS